MQGAKRYRPPTFARVICALSVVMATSVQADDSPVCRDGVQTCAYRAALESAARKIDFWRPALARPLTQRIGVAPPELVEFLRQGNIAQSISDKPRAAVAAPDFAADVTQALEELPAPVKALLTGKLAGIYLVEGLGGTGLTDLIVDAGGQAVAGFVVLDPGVLQRRANEWATWKENTPFVTDAAYELISEIEADDQNNRKNAIQYILLHELAHVISIGGNLHPPWNVLPKDVSSLSAYTFFPLSWARSTDRARYESLFDADFPRRKDIVYYFGAKLRAAQMVETYDTLERTNFPTLYAATRPGDDFAESFASYVHTVMMQKPFTIRISHNGKTVKVFDACWKAPRCADKKQLLEKLLAGAGAAPRALVSIADEIVDNFRKVIVLHGAGNAKLSRESTQAGHYLFFRSRQLTAQIVDRAVRDGAECQVLLDYWNAGAGWQELDRLAFGGMFAEIENKLDPANACVARVKAARKTVQTIRADYNREITAVLDDRDDTKAGNRPKWSAYLTFVNQKYSAGGIVADVVAAPVRAVVGTRPLSTIQALAKRAVRDEWTDGELPDKTVLLTFDDGPHPVYTPRILDILAAHRLRAVFFMIGQNLGSLDAAGNAHLREPALVARLLKEGHYIANHTHTHPLLPRLDEVQLTDEIDVTESLLTAAAPGGEGRARFFRAPYGARNDLVLSEIAAHGLRSVLWNIDSRDWADPIAASIAKRVVDEVVHEGRGIILFHDIHLRSVEALPLVIDELVKRGFRFAYYDGNSLVTDGTR